ncbi:unnamed protein product [Coregonus sp. 'balchen']|nr:unnamed protein product [Coregonus sp. 'balchen']
MASPCWAQQLPAARAGHIDTKQHNPPMCYSVSVCLRHRRDTVSENAKQDLKDGLSLYNTDNNVGLRNAWNIIQAEWKCCGVVGYTDWHEALKEKMVPDRCCQEHYQECGRNSTNMFWTRGCYEKVEEWLDDNKHLMGTIGMCILVVQLLGMAFSMTLFQQIHRTGKKYDA